jgi:dihydrolipoamide dehydrogenase
MLQHAKNYGLSAENVTIDPKAVVDRSRAVSKRLNDGVGFLMKKNKVSVIWGEAAIDAPGKVTVKASNTEAPKGALDDRGLEAKLRRADGGHVAARAGTDDDDVEIRVSHTAPFPAILNPSGLARPIM